MKETLLVKMREGEREKRLKGREKKSWLEPSKTHFICVYSDIIFLNVGVKLIIFKNGNIMLLNNLCCNIIICYILAAALLASRSSVFNEVGKVEKWPYTKLRHKN